MLADNRADRRGMTLATNDAHSPALVCEHSARLKRQKQRERKRMSGRVSEKVCTSSWVCACVLVYLALGYLCVRVYSAAVVFTAAYIFWFSRTHFRWAERHPSLRVTTRVWKKQQNVMENHRRNQPIHWLTRFRTFVRLHKQLRIFMRIHSNTRSDICSSYAYFDIRRWNPSL